MNKNAGKSKKQIMLEKCLKDIASFLHDDYNHYPNDKNFPSESAKMVRIQTINKKSITWVKNGSSVIHHVIKKDGYFLPKTVENYLKLKGELDEQNYI